MMALCDVRRKALRGPHVLKEALCDMVMRNMLGLMFGNAWGRGLLTLLELQVIGAP